MDEKFAWESTLTQRYEMDLDRDREWLESLWEQQILPEVEFARVAAEGDTSELINELVKTAKPFCEAYLAGLERGGESGVGGRPRGSGSKDGLSKRIKFDAKTETHIRALSEYLSKIAAVERRVMEFRRRYLGEPTATVAPAEAPRLLKAWSVDPGAESEDDVSLYWLDEERPTRFRGGYWSAIGTLDRLGNYLAKKYPWNKDQALDFVLCGGPQQAKTVSGKPAKSKDNGPAAHRFDRCTITLEIEAWMPPELVKRAYVRLQQEARVNKGLVGSATTTRRSYGRNAEVFRFVVNQSEISVVSEKENLGKLVLPDSWRELRKLWDDHLSTGDAWRYGENGSRNFHRDFMRGQKATTGSNWGLPGYPGQPVTYAEEKTAEAEFIERLSAQVEQSKRVSSDQF